MEAMRHSPPPPPSVIYILSSSGIYIYILYIPRDGGEPDPFSVWKGSKAALRGSTGEHRGSGEGAERVQAAEYSSISGGSLLRLLSSVVVTQWPLKEISQ